MIVSIMRQLFVLIPAAYILAKLGGLHVSVVVIPDCGGHFTYGILLLPGTDQPDRSFPGFQRESFSRTVLG